MYYLAMHVNLPFDIVLEILQQQNKHQSQLVNMCNSEVVIATYP